MNLPELHKLLQRTVFQLIDGFNYISFAKIPFDQSNEICEM